MSQTFEWHKKIGAELPIIGGAMYPCSNPELIAAVSEAGGIGVVQPLTLAYVCKLPVAEGLKKIRSLTRKPIGFNVLLETDSKIYLDRMKAWIDIALENEVKFFVTALGNPRWVVDRVRSSGALVFHDVVARKWAEKALEGDVDGFIGVNGNAGGHAGMLSPEALYAELKGFGKPVICAGGIGDAEHLARALEIGYQGAQIGTRFIATPECHAPQDYKDAIVGARSQDIVLTERVTGIPLAVIRTPYVESVGLKAGGLARILLKNRKTKKWMRLLYQVLSFWKLKASMNRGAMSTKDYYQAGKSVEGVEKIEPVADIMARFRKVCIG